MKVIFLTLIFVSILILKVEISNADSAVKIGWIGPLTGDVAIVGVDSAEVAKQVFQTANESGGINGRKVELLLEDDQYQAAKSVAAYNRLVHVEGVRIIFIITYGGMKAISPLAERDNVLIINPLDCDEELAALPQNSFCIAKKTEDLGTKNAEHAIRHGNLPAAIIFFDGDPFMPKVAKATRAALEHNGANVTLFEGVSGKIDFRSLLVRAKEQKVRSIFLYGNDDFGTGMKQARQLGIDAKFYALTMLNSPGYRAAAAGFENGTFTAGWFAPRTPQYTKFLAKFKTKVGREPLIEVATVPTYDIATIIIKGLEKILNTQEAPLQIDALRDYLYGVSGYEGLSGILTMDSDGAVRTLHVGMYSYDHGKYQSVE